MTIVLGLLLGMLAVAYSSVPLLRRAEEAPPEPEEAHGRERLVERRATIYENIRDLDFEYAMGKLTEEDYGVIRQTMVRDAATVLQEMETTSRDEALDRWIEAEVRSRRETTTKARACPACGVRTVAGASFCDACGAGLAALAPACGKCGAGQRPGAKFCRGCGAKL